MKKILLLLVSIVVFVNIQAQDIHFTQVNQIPLLLNPGNTGNSVADFRGFVNYKNQWKAFGEAYKTGMFSFDMHLIEKKSGVLSAGLVMYKDNAGDIYRTTGFSGNIAYNLSLTDHQGLSVGLGIGYLQYKFDTDNPMWGTQYDGSGYNSSLPADLESGNFTAAAGALDLSGGVVWHFNKANNRSFSNDGLKINVGVSGFHLNQPAIKLSSITSTANHRKIVFHGDAQIGKESSNLSILPSIVTQFSGKSKEIIAGLLFRYTIQQASRSTGLNNEIAFSLGGNLRLGDAIAPTMLFEYGDFALGMSYDVNLSKLTQITTGRGGLEFSLQYRSSKK